MWKCPKCGREFQKQDQGHYCTKPEDIDEYIAFQDESVRPYLQAVRKAIGNAIPEAEEKISWSMPTFWKEHKSFSLQALKTMWACIRGRRLSGSFPSV